MGPAEVRDQAGDDDAALPFDIHVRGERSDDELSLHIVTAPRCPRGTRVDDGDVPRFELGLTRCDEEAGERMLFSVDTLAFVVDDMRAPDSKARVLVSPSVSNVRVPLSSLSDSLALFVDGERGARILDGGRVSLVVEGELVHRHAGATYSFGRRTVVVREVDDVVASLARRAAALATGASESADAIAPVDGAAYETEVIGADDASVFVAFVEARCQRGQRPLLAVSSTTAEGTKLHVVTERRASPVVCDVVLVEDLEEVPRVLAARRSSPAIAVGFGRRAVLVFVDGA